MRPGQARGTAGAAEHRGSSAVMERGTTSQAVARGNTSHSLSPACDVASEVSPGADRKPGLVSG